MPQWIGEMQVTDQELKLQELGAPPRDLAAYSGWRETVSTENAETISFYARYLVGQYSGLSEALSLPAVQAALEIDGVPREEWPEMTERLVRLHGLFERHRPRKERA